MKALLRVRQWRVGRLTLTWFPFWFRWDLFFSVCRGPGWFIWFAFQFQLQPRRKS